MLKTTQEVTPIGSHKNFQTLLPLYFEQEVLGACSPATIEAKKYDLKLFVQHMHSMNGAALSVEAWLPRDTREFLNHLTKESYSPATINRVLATIRSFGNWLHENGHVVVNPTKGIRDLQLDPLAPKAIRDREWHRIQKTADLLALRPKKAYSQGERNKAILAALNASGLRISELLGLRLHQFVGKRFLNVMCKGGKIRSVLITQEAADVIRSYVEFYRVADSDFLFTNRYGQRLSRNGIADAFDKIAAHTNVNLSPNDHIELRPHLLRHRHAYKARSAHGDVFAAKRLGHSSLKHLERYSMLTEIEESELLAQL